MSGPAHQRRHRPFLLRAVATPLAAGVGRPAATLRERLRPAVEVVRQREEAGAGRAVRRRELLRRVDGEVPREERVPLVRQVGGDGAGLAKIDENLQKAMA